MPTPILGASTYNTRTISYHDIQRGSLLAEARWCAENDSMAVGCNSFAFGYYDETTTLEPWLKYTLKEGFLWE